MDRENIMPKKIEFESCDHLPERGFAHHIGWPGARVRSPTPTFPNVRKKTKIRIMKSPCQESLLSTLKKGVPSLLRILFKKKKKPILKNSYNFLRATPGRI